jgi:ABC-type enterochelin transport system ATPase subunit
MIMATSLTKRYGATTVVDDVSFTSPPGTVTGYLGPKRRRRVHHLAHAGRSQRPDAGAATIAGMPFRRIPNPAGDDSRASTRLPCFRLMDPRPRVRRLSPGAPLA